MTMERLPAADEFSPTAMLLKPVTLAAIPMATPLVAVALAKAPIATEPLEASVSAPTAVA